MVAYAELASCRRAHLLAYFGEAYPPENCRGCDVCLSRPEEFDATIISQKIMSAILRTGEQFGASHIIDVLRGARNQKILERRHEQLSVYGIVPDFSKEDLRHLIGQLVSRKLLVKYGDEFPILGIAQLGQAFLKNREAICLPKPKANGKASQPGAAAEAGYDQELFEQLRRLRKNLADEKGVPPFVVFGDLSLRQMALYLPQSAESFAGISGVGAEKLKQYGEIFTEVIQAYARENQLSEKDIPVKRTATPRRITPFGADLSGNQETAAAESVS